MKRISVSCELKKLRSSTVSAGANPFFLLPEEVGGYCSGGEALEGGRRGRRVGPYFQKHQTRSPSSTSENWQSTQMVSLATRVGNKNRRSEDLRRLYCDQRHRHPHRLIVDQTFHQTVYPAGGDSTI